MEITRKKARQSLYQVQFSPCDVCGGSSFTLLPKTVAIQIIRRLRHMVQVRHIKGDILIEAHPDVLALLKDKKRKAEWERELKRTLYFEESHHPNRKSFPFCPTSLDDGRKAYVHFLLQSCFHVPFA